MQLITQDYDDIVNTNFSVVDNDECVCIVKIYDRLQATTEL